MVSSHSYPYTPPTITSLGPNLPYVNNLYDSPVLRRW